MIMMKMRMGKMMMVVVCKMRKRRRKRMMRKMVKVMGREGKIVSSIVFFCFFLGKYLFFFYW